MSMTNHQWLAAEPFTLALSAGFFGFFTHAGFLRAVHEAGLTPRRVVGVSAGAIAGGIYASGVAPRDMEHELLRLKRVDFWDPDWPAGGFLRGDKFAAKLADVLRRSGIETIEDCPIVFNPVVFDVRTRQTVVLREGPLNLSIRASAALPALFRPVWIGDRLCIDGGLRDRAGVTALATHERSLVHHLPSTSPWRVFFKKSRFHGTVSRRTLELYNLPRVTPFAMVNGAACLTMAYERTMRWLERDIWAPLR